MGPNKTDTRDPPTTCTNLSQNQLKYAVHYLLQQPSLSMAEATDYALVFDSVFLILTGFFTFCGNYTEFDFAKCAT